MTERDVLERIELDRLAVVEQAQNEKDAENRAYLRGKEDAFVEVLSIISGKHAKPRLYLVKDTPDE